MAIIPVCQRRDAGKMGETAALMGALTKINVENGKTNMVYMHNEVLTLVHYVDILFPSVLGQIVHMQQLNGFIHIFLRKGETMGNIQQTAAGKEPGLFHRTWIYLKQHWQLYLLFLGPALVLTLVFKYGPMGGILIAFQKYNPIKGILGSKWVGLKYFRQFLSSPDFLRYLANTLKLSVFGLLWGFPVPIILALLLNRIESSSIKQKIQLVLYMPNFISVIVLCGMVRILLSVTGPLNMLMGTSINFLTIPAAFRPIYIISGIWQGAGWASIMYTASLSNASKELKEAAQIDGANIFQQIKTVEWPAIKDMVVIQFILQAGNIMSIGFEKAYALQTDLNLASSEIIATYVYKKGLLSGDYSFSTAVGLFNTVINVIFLLTVNKIVKKMNDGQGL